MGLIGNFMERARTAKINSLARAEESEQIRAQKDGLKLSRLKRQEEIEIHKARIAKLQNKSGSSGWKDALRNFAPTNSTPKKAKQKGFGLF